MAKTHVRSNSVYTLCLCMTFIELRVRTLVDIFTRVIAFFETRIANTFEWSNRVHTGCVHRAMSSFKFAFIQIWWHDKRKALQVIIATLKSAAYVFVRGVHASFKVTWLKIRVDLYRSKVTFLRKCPQAMNNFKMHEDLYFFTSNFHMLTFTRRTITRKTIFTETLVVFKSVNTSCMRMTSV